MTTYQNIETATAASDERLSSPFMNLSPSAGFGGDDDEFGDEPEEDDLFGDDDFDELDEDGISIEADELGDDDDAPFEEGEEMQFEEEFDDEE